MQRRAFLVIGAAVLLAFAWGLVELLSLRLQKGDALPRFSTYRTDPMGAKALYESLDGIEGMRAERNLEAPEDMNASTDDVVYFVGMRWWGDINEIEKPLIEKWQSIAEEGGRVVLGFQPVREDPREAPLSSLDDLGNAQQDTAEEDTPEEAENTPADEESEGLPENKDSAEDEAADDAESGLMPWDAETVMLTEYWGMRCAFEALEEPAEDPDGWSGYWAERVSAPENFPKDLPLSTALYFCDLQPEWRVVYGLDDKAVVIERTFGDGSVVLFADSMPFSNQGLWRAAHLGLTPVLSWTAGQAERAIFDEYLKGIRRRQGTMTLARSYHLHGLGLGLLIVFLLVVWRRLCPLAPVRSEEEGEALGVEGHTSTTTLAQLLRRSIAPRELLSHCAREWSEHAPGPAARREAVAGELERIASESEPGHLPVAYGRMSAAAARRWRPKR
jgi:hypothetical protein